MQKNISPRIVSSAAIFLTVIFFFLTAYLNFNLKEEQQFSNLAKSFLEGKTYFLEMPGSWNDTVFFKGKFYWPLGPFPSILLMPFVYIFSLFGSFFFMGYLQFFLVFGNFIVIYKISRIIRYSSSDSVYLALAFSCASAFIGVAAWPWSWTFAQVVTVFLIFLSLLEYSTKKRYWLIGLIVGFIMATRVTASLILIYFVIDLFWLSKEKKKDSAKKLAELLLPVFITVLLLMSYNYLRFGSFSELGYSQQILSKTLIKARSYGTISPVHIPGNLYYFFVSMPIPVLKDDLSPVLKFPYIRANPWGMSLFITSPYFIYLFALEYKDKTSKGLWGAILVIALPIFLYYGVGFRQFGYRYSLDFLPLLFFLLIRNYRHQFGSLSNKFKALITISSCIDIYLFLTFHHYTYTNR